LTRSETQNQSQNDGSSRSDPLWLPGSAAPVQIKPDAVHVWRAVFDPQCFDPDRCRAVLNTDELSRADRFRFQKHHDWFVFRRASLRRVLARYTGIDADRITFDYGGHGKPVLPADANPTGVTFNASHSHGLALIAVSLGRRLGVDVELIQDGLREEGLAQRFFTANEVAALESLPASQQELGFYLCWSRKEAYVKARGQGLSLPLDSFEVSVSPEQPAALLWTRQGDAETGRWSVHTLTPDPRYAAALIVDGSKHPPICCWNLE